ncbi:MAG: hypothetical protein JWP78_1455 [Mucilaginibacter sp.]|nr:hypothetical protein [Mucilaginibacter sp.]
MIRRYLFAILLPFVCLTGQAQSLSFAELQSLTNMADNQAHDYLLLSKGFSSAGRQVLNGRNFDLFKSNRTDPSKAETLSLRASAMGTGGNVSRQVIYSTLRRQDINSLLEQARRSTMALVFRGSDQYKDIYRFDNSLFMAIISAGFDKKSGSVVMEEK